MKRLLIVASKTGYQTKVFAEAAVRAGYDVQMATDRCHTLDDPWADHAIPLRFEHPQRAAAIIAESGVEIHGVVAVGDRPAQIAALAAQLLGLPHNPDSAVLACRNKNEARRAFSSAGLLVPAYRRVPLNSNPNDLARTTRFPCVLKPLGLSGSRGVIRADNPAEFAAAFARIHSILAKPEILRLHEDQNRYLQIEDFIPGAEFAVEGVLTGGHLDVLAIFDKPDPLDGPYFEETIYVTPSGQPGKIQRKILDTTRRAVEALGLTHGPVHAEMRVNQEGVWMLEVAARPIGGLCARILRFDDGDGLEEFICRHAAQDPTGSTRLADPARAVMMIPIPRDGIYQSTDGLDDARSVEGIEDIEITAKPGQKLIPLPEGASYMGFIFSKGGSPKHAIEALRRAHDNISFEIATTLQVV